MGFRLGSVRDFILSWADLYRSIQGREYNLNGYKWYNNINIFECWRKTIAIELLIRNTGYK